MRSPIRWLRRRSELARNEKRRAQIEAEFSAHVGVPLEVIPAPSKGGYDQIYFAIKDGKRFAVIRANSPHKVQSDPIGPDDPGIPMDPATRLELEWNAYSKLFPLGLSPEPLWRTSDAIACSWIRWRRASRMLVKRRELTWNILTRVLHAIPRMHAAGVTHLDLNTGNFLVQKTGPGIAIIDFEFGPQAWVTLNQQQAFDYLTAINDFLKPRRGGDVILSDLPRLVELLDSAVPAAIRYTPLAFSLRRLRRLAGEPILCEMLERTFPRLRDENES